MRIRNGKQNRAQYLFRPAPRMDLDEHNIIRSICVYCHAELPQDLAFQAYHMLKEHGLEV